MENMKLSDINRFVLPLLSVSGIVLLVGGYMLICHARVFLLILKYIFAAAFIILGAVILISCLRILFGLKK